MVRTSKELGRGRREKWRRRACAPRPSVFLPCLISFLPLLVSRIGALFSAWLCVALWPSVLFLWVRFCPDCGPLGRKGPFCKCELDRESGTERHIVLGVLGELGVQSDPVSCHHRTKLSAVTHTPLLPEPLLCLFAAKICKRLQSYADKQISILQVLESFLIKETPLKVRESMEPSFLQFVLYLFLLYYIMYS